VKPRIVLSGVNLVEGGPLSVFQDALRELSVSFSDRYTITALVHRRELFDIPDVEYLEFPAVKNSWLRRLRFEYRHCKKLSERLQPFLWLSMHDITPRVVAARQAVYCHNPAPFYRLPFREAMLDKTFAMFHVLYRFLYRVNIGRNDFVVVQQEWLRQEFRRRYKVRNVVVAHPTVRSTRLPQAKSVDSKILFYPAFPRCFKNLESLLRAVDLLEHENVPAFEVWITISGQENAYAAMLKKEFGHLKTVRWLGLQTRARVEELYAAAGCLVFISKLESWGMPISEWKITGKPMIVADLPYAHETVGDYELVRFVDTSEVTEISQAIREFLQSESFGSPARAATIPAPFAADWNALFRILLNKALPAKAGQAERKGSL